MTAHLNNFRFFYTLNYAGEEGSPGSGLLPLERDEALFYSLSKMSMWIPIISHVTSTIFLVVMYKECKGEKNAAWPFATAVSRAVFAIICPPILIPIDLIGTLVKLVIDHMNKRKAIAHPV